MGDITKEGEAVKLKVGNVIRGGKMILEDFLPDLLQQEEIKILAVKMNVENLKGGDDKSSIVILQTLIPVTGDERPLGERGFLRVYVMDLEKYK